MKSISLVMVVLLSIITGCQKYQPLDGGVILSPGDIETLNRTVIPNVTVPGVCRGSEMFELRTIVAIISAEAGPRGRIGHVDLFCRITSFVCANGIFETETREEGVNAC